MANKKQTKKKVSKPKTSKTKKTQLKRKSEVVSNPTYIKVMNERVDKMNEAGKKLSDLLDGMAFWEGLYIIERMKYKIMEQSMRCGCDDCSPFDDDFKKQLSKALSKKFGKDAVTIV